MTVLTGTRMLVTGAGGMVGSYVPEVFRDLELKLTCGSGETDRLDICQPLAVREAIRAFRPDWVLHLAAATDVDRCEQEPEWAFRVNAIGTQNLALACQGQDIPLVYISTAAVFWGDKPEPYTEFDPVRPINRYGQSKRAGEEIVLSLLKRFCIVRAGWMVGGKEKDKKFVGKIARFILEGREGVKVVHDKIGSPTYARDFLQGIRRLLEGGRWGLYHLANVGQASRYEIAQAIREALQRPEIRLEPVSSNAFPLPAPRGRSEAIRNFKLELMDLPLMRPWKDALREYLLAEWLPSMCLKET